jgi:hypothetical protein
LKNTGIILRLGHHHFQILPFQPLYDSTLHRLTLDSDGVVEYTTKTYIYSFDESVWMLWHVCPKPELWSQQRQPLLWNGSANTPVARQWLSSRHVIAATDTSVIMENTFSVRSVPGLYNED